jgi:CheY-specific phosphatase CheX
VKNTTHNFLNPMIQRAKEFLKQDMDIEVTDFMEPINCLQIDESLKNISTIGISGSANFTTVTIYDNHLLEKFVDIFLDGEGCDNDEKDEIFQSVANEIANTIIGNALPEDENELFITPPTFLSDTTSLLINKNSKILISSVKTNYGKLSIMAIY